jgi:CHAT domain-containing protein/Tfp pilus assembly protein PilF
MTRMLRSRFDEALPRFVQAHSIWKQMGVQHQLAGAANNIAICYGYLGDFERALDYRQEALRVVRPSARQAEVLGETGNLYIFQRQPREAIPFYRQAHEVAKRYGAISEAARWAGNLTIALGEVGDWDGAEKANQEALSLNPEPRSKIWLELDKAAIAVSRKRYDEARTTYERALATSGKNPPVLLHSHAGLANLFLALGDPANANRSFESAIDVINTNRSDLNRNEHKITYLARLMRIYQEYVDALMTQNRPAKAMEIADSSRARILAERLTLPSELPRQAGEHAFREIARRSGSVWLSYWLAPRHSYLWVVTPTKICHFVLPPADQLTKWVEQYREFIEKSLGDPMRTRSEAGDRLFQALLAPALPLLPRGSRVVIIPDGPLHLLNFETLPVYGDQPRYFVEDAVVSIAPSFAAFLPYKVRSASSALVIGDPESATPEYPRLAHAAAEVSTVAKRFADSAIKTITAKEAHPKAYLAAKPEEFSVIHIAAHAEVNRQSPLDSAVILSPAADGYKLYARDVMNIPLQAELVTISACRSSGARAYAGEGLVGFAWAFLQAGAHSVIAGLWDVADRSTALLMDKMYEEIAAGKAPAEALREAKLFVLRTAHPKPYYWGPFQLYSR